jgi:malonate transporter and related proteins
LYVAIPALIIRAIGRGSLLALADGTFLLAYAGGSLAAFATGFGFARWRGDDVKRSAMTGMGMSMSNTGFIGHPVVALVFGPPAVIGLSLCLMIENLLMIPLSIGLAEAGLQTKAAIGVLVRETLLRTLKSPIVIGMLVGVTVSLLGLPMPDPVWKVIDMFASASAPVALFAIGGSLVGLSVTDLRGSLPTIVAGKLLLHPLLVFLGFWLLRPSDPALASMGVILASVPMLGIYPLLGQRYGMAQICAAALLFATMTSVLTLSAVIWIAGPH